MSQDNRLEHVKQLVQMQRLDFEKLAKVHGAVTFLQEASFALQIIQDSDYLQKIAMANPDSFRRAILNVAIIGISLNPFEREAYLIPRKNKNRSMNVCLDVSYTGYRNLYIKTGAIQWAIPEIHHEKDDWEWRGFDQKPHHKFDPSIDRGKMKGCYVCTKLANGDMISKYMRLEEIYHIRDTYSESWKSENRIYSTWKTQELDMIKKTVIRQARKDWPKANDSRIQEMERIVQEADPATAPAQLASDPARTDLILKIRTGLEIIGWSQQQHLEICRRAYGSPELQKLEDLPTMDLQNALRMINQEVDEQNAKRKK